MLLSVFLCVFFDPECLKINPPRERGGKGKGREGRKEDVKHALKAQRSLLPPCI